MSMRKQIKDMPVGKKYGQWELIGISHQRLDSRNAYYYVRCSCGTETAVCGSGLRNGTSTRCRKCAGRGNGRKGLDIMANDAAYFYAMRCGPYVKFGVSNDPERRLKDILSSNPYDTELIWSEPNEEGLENFYHTLYTDRHHRGEWFEFNNCEI